MLPTAHTTRTTVIAGATVVVLGALGLTACSSSAGGHSAGGSSAVSASSAPAGECGTVSVAAPDDPNALLKGIPSQYRANYDGYEYQLHKSAWANWKPSRSSGLKVGVILGSTANPAQVSTLDALKAGLKQNPAVGSVDVTVSNDTLTTELQDYQTMVRQGENLIVLQPVSTAAEIPVIEAAAKKSIPTVIIGSQLATDDAVTVAFNWEKAGAQQAAAVAGLMGGKGEVLEAQGIPGLAINNAAMTGFKLALDRCPSIKNLGSITGSFSPTVAKTAILNFLATHPQPISGIFEVGGAGQAAVSSFQQAGRPLPALNFAGPTESELVLWKQLAAKGLKAVAAVQSAAGLGTGLAEVVNRMLAGDGIRTTAVVASWQLITASQLNSVVQPGWSSQSTASVDIDSANSFPTAFVDSLFTHTSGS